MSKIARLIWVDEFIWSQFQALYPQQASKFIRDNLQKAINIKLDVSDQELNSLRREGLDLKQSLEKQQEYYNQIQAKIRSSEAKKRKEYLDAKAEEKKRLERGRMADDTLRSTGMAEKMGEDFS